MVMSELGLKLDGIDELLKVMHAIEKDMEAANGRAVLAGGRVIQKEAKARAPVRDGGPKKTYLGTYREPENLKKSIKVKVLKPKEPGRRLALVGPAVGRREAHDGFYGDWVEKGHRIARFVGKTPDKRYRNYVRMVRRYEFGDSKTQPRPFMRPAFDAKAQEAQRKMVEVYKKVIDRKWEKGKTIEAIGDIIEGD